MIQYLGERKIFSDNKPDSFDFWKPNKIYQDKVVIIIGGGPSHAKLNLSELNNVRFIAVNSSCRKIFPIATKNDILYFSDNSWQENRPELVQLWPGFVVTSNRNTKARLGLFVDYLDVSRLTEEMQVKSDYVQASSGHTAACLAAIMGARRLVLIGFECQAILGKTHGHDDYTQGDMLAFKERFLPGWTGLSFAFKQMEVEVINSTPNSLIKEFDFMPFEDAVRG